MTPEQSLREKLRKIEALFAGAATEGEKVAAGTAAERIRDRLGQAAGKEKEIEVKFSISDVWSRQLFVALCRRYGPAPSAIAGCTDKPSSSGRQRDSSSRSCGPSSKS